MHQSYQKEKTLKNNEKEQRKLSFVQKFRKSSSSGMQVVWFLRTILMLSIILYNYFIHRAESPVECIVNESEATSRPLLSDDSTNHLVRWKSQFVWIFLVLLRKIWYFLTLVNMFSFQVSHNKYSDYSSRRIWTCKDVIWVIFWVTFACVNL